MSHIIGRENRADPQIGSTKDVTSSEINARNGNRKNGLDTAIVGIADGLKMRVRVNTGDSTIIYVGLADAGALTSEAKWQITRYDTTPTATSGEVNSDHPSGNSGFVHIFDNRESLSYS